MIEAADEVSCWLWTGQTET